MAPVPPRTLSRHDRLLRLTIAACFAAVVGGAAAHVRPLIRGPVHYEALATHFVLLPALCSWLVWSQRRVRWSRAVAWLALEIFTACAAFTLAWTAVRMTVFDDLLHVMGLYFVIMTVLGAAILEVWQKRHPPAPGPYCPACAYCLIGSAADRCPECGRPSTLDELGVPRAALEPSPEG